MSEGRKALYTSPMPPKVEGEFQITRMAFTRSPKVLASASSAVWMAAEWPRPSNSTICSANFKPSSVESALSMASTGESFSRVSGSLGPTSLHSATRILVFSGTLKPACSAIQAAGLPTTAAFNLAPPQLLLPAFTPKMNSSSSAFSFLLTKYTP